MQRPSWTRLLWATLAAVVVAGVVVTFVSGVPHAGLVGTWTIRAVLIAAAVFYVGQWVSNRPF